MTTFAFEARDAAGRRVRGVEIAPTEDELDRLLGDRELLLVSAREATQRARGRPNARTFIDFCFHLGTIVEAGIPLVEGLRDLREEGASPIARELEDIVQRVEGGQRLSDALGAHPRYFPELVRALVAAGEESGNLDLILRDLTAYLEWREDLRRKVVAALAYPSIVVLGIIGLVVLLTTVVLPRFLGLFQELHVDLPLSTRILIALQGFAESYGLAVVVGLAAVVAAAALGARTEKGRRALHRALLHIPVAGRVVLMVEMSRLSHNLGLLYKAGLPITRSVELSQAVVQNRVVRDMLGRTRDEIGRGRSLAGALGRGGLMPAMVMRMVSLGEQSGRLDEALQHVSAYYDREVPVVIDRALLLVNTAVIVILGLTLGTIAFSIFVPLYQMMGNLNG